jgi:rare lipoprotein A
VLAALVCCAIGCGGRRTPRAVTPRIGQTQRGIASWYGNPYHGRRAANGEIFDMEKLTAAHRTYAFGTWVRVHNLDNGRTVDVRITDRGPFIDRRIIDLSRAAAREIEMIGPGLAKVKLEVIRPPEAAASNSREGKRAASKEEIRSAAPSIAEAAPRIAIEKFAVQVGAFRDRGNAESRRRDFEKADRPARLIRRDAPVPVWRVVVGEFERIEDAEALAAEIRAGGVEAMTVRLDGAP